MYGSVDDFYQKVVAVDYDDTISHHDSAWLKILKAFELTGYRVIIVTYRQPNMCPEDLQFLKDAGYKVYFTGQKSKREFMRRLNIDVNIWIDDKPETVLFDYTPSTGIFDINPRYVE